MFSTLQNRVHLYRNVLDEYTTHPLTHQLFGRMASTVEGSPWHREANVLVHTQMVLEEYIKQLGEKELFNEYLGALACIFHDVGKPDAKKEKYKPERGTYFAFHGHEVISARYFEDFWVRSGKEFLTPTEQFTVSWMIENHMPWSITDEAKLLNLLRTAKYYDVEETWFRALRADQRGRIADDHEKKLRDVEEWIENIMKLSELAEQTMPARPSGEPTLYMPIAPSGAGKSTLFRKLKVEHPDLQAFSLDALRHEWYDPNDYHKAWQASTEDKQFEQKANQRFLEMIKTGKDLFVDNTNLSARRRRFYLNEAKRRGYRTVAMLLPVDLKTLIARQQSRGDKTVPEKAVRQQFFSLQLPQIGEFDQIVSPNEDE